MHHILEDNLPEKTVIVGLMGRLFGHAGSDDGRNFLDNGYEIVANASISKVEGTPLFLLRPIWRKDMQERGKRAIWPN